MQDQDRKTPVTGPNGRLRVLVVEDEPLLSLSLESMLEDWGHEVVGAAATGAAAVRLAREQRPAVVLMDINLAGPMDGVAAAAQIRSFLDARIIFMTAYSIQDIASRTAELNAELEASIIHKPFSPDRLNRMLSAGQTGQTAG
jgi:two-component system, response regulator PdtaR